MNYDSKLLVFDLDGTLIDSRRDIGEAVNWSLQKRGIDRLPLEMIDRYAGSGIQPLLRKLFDDLGRNDFAEAIDDFKEYYGANLVVHTKLFTGAMEVLQHFDKTPKVILTNKTNQFIRPILEHFSILNCFEQYYGRHSFPTRKPDPGPLLSIASEFGFSPSEMLMIGDTEADIIAGQSAGAKTCAALYGYSDKLKLKELKPTYTASTPLELKDL